MTTVQRILFRGESSSNLINRFKFKTNSLPGIPNQQKYTAQEPKTVPKDERKLRNLTYFASALALGSVGAITFLATRNAKLSSKVVRLASDLQDANTRLTLKITEEITKAVQKAEQSSLKLTQRLEESLSQKDKQIRELGKWQDGQIEGIREDLTSRINSITSSVSAAEMESILLRPVNVNGLNMELASVHHGYGVPTPQLEQALRSESTKRIFGIVDRSKIVPPEEVMVRVPTSEFVGFTKAGGMAVVPRDVIANLGALVNKKQKIKLVVDTPLYLGQVEPSKFYRIKRVGETYEYFSEGLKGEIKKLADLELIDTMRIPIYADKGKSEQVVQIFRAKDLQQPVDFYLMMQWLEKDLAKKVHQLVEKHIPSDPSKGTPFVFDTGHISIKFDPKTMTKPQASVKYDAIFYKHDKFRMEGPTWSDRTKNIYDNLTHEAGETERFIYFDKFFYEHLWRSEESSKVPLRADLIIGNDWQTGGISAMMRLLSLVRKHFGSSPQVADKLYNTPILTIMHNAGLSGEIDHSQAKLLNVLFGQHAEFITKNAWLTKNSGLNSDYFNCLFHGQRLNPQTMAVAYSDVITPVSKGYGAEMSGHSGFGSVNHDLYRMRGRTHEFSNLEHIRFLAEENGLDRSLVTSENLAYRPITNGCDRANNMLTIKIARELEHDLGLESGSLKLFDKLDPESILEIHNHNKEIYLRKLIADVESARKGGDNPLLLELADRTNLEGVSANTPVFSTAGRIEDQKGLDIWAQAIEEYLNRHHDDADLPLFYTQGIGQKVFIDQLLDVKRRIAVKFGQKAADRIVFAKVFDTPHYRGCAMMSDFTIMSSWFEPCGLVHKELAPFSASIPLINRVGGLAEGLKDGFSALISDFHNKFDNYEEAIGFNRWAFANTLDRALAIFRDKTQFAKMLKNSFEANHSWLKSDGAMKEYAQTFVDLKVLKPEVLQHS